MSEINPIIVFAECFFDLGILYSEAPKKVQNEAKLAMLNQFVSKFDVTITEKRGATWSPNPDNDHAPPKVYTKLK